MADSLITFVPFLLGLSTENQNGLSQALVPGCSDLVWDTAGVYMKTCLNIRTLQFGIYI